MFNMNSINMVSMSSINMFSMNSINMFNMNIINMFRSIVIFVAGVIFRVINGARFVLVIARIGGKIVVSVRVFCSLII
nr:hypothetical protein BaRGS_020376 [Batillaria attramentaria]